MYILNIRTTFSELYDIVSITIILVSLSVYTTGQSQTETNLDRTSLYNSLEFTHFDTSDGLSNNYVNSIDQDSLGFIWIATIDGLNRYDGENFKSFSKENSTLTDNYINQVFSNRHEGLYLATNDGLKYYSAGTNTFKPIFRKNSTLSSSISSISERRDGSYIIGDYSWGIHIFKDNKELDLVYRDSTLNDRLDNLRISTITTHEDSIIWAGTYNDGTFKVNISSLNQISVEKVFNEKTNSIFIDSGGNTWFGTDAGLKVITAHKDTLTLNDKNGNLSDYTIKTIEEDNYKNLWIGTRNGGLNILDGHAFVNQSPRVEVWHFSPSNDGTSVHHRDITSIHKDARGDMWIGTGAGLDFVNPQGGLVTLQNSNSKKETLSHDRVSALSHSTDNSIWVGTDGGGVHLRHNTLGIINTLTKEDGLSNNFIVSLLEDKSQNLWVGTYRGGLNKYNLKTGKWDYYLQGSISDGSDVRVIYEDLNQDIWVGTNRGGLYKYDKTNNMFAYVEALGKKDIRDIKQRDHGELWLATYGNGIYKYDLDTGIFQNLSTAVADFPTNIFFSLNFLDNSHLLAGTMNEGLLIVDLVSKSVKQFKEEHGLSNNTVQSILKDRNNLFWLGTSNGISIYNPRGNTLKDLRNLSKLKGNEFNNGAALLDNERNLYFGGNNGLAIFKSNLMDSFKKERFETIFNDIEIFSEKEKFEKDQEADLEKSITFQDSIILEYDRKLVSVEFSALSYPNSDQIEYSYLIEGYNNYWIDLENFRKINFSHLPPGDYTLRLKTNASDFYTSDKELSISILPPIWRTIPAYFVYILIVLGVSWKCIRYYKRRYTLKQSLRFEKEQRRMEIVMNEERVRFYTGFSHELKTPLTMILAPLENLMQEIKSKKHKSQLYLIDKNAKVLLHRINKLLNFRQTEEGLNKLTGKEYNLAQHIANWTEMYEPLIRKSGVQIKSTIQSPCPGIYCDLEKIQIVFNNLMSNAIKFSGSDGDISINVFSNEKGITFSVEDTGVGIPLELRSRIFEWYYHSKSQNIADGTGIGLALSKNFVELHDGNIQVESEEGQKTTFTVFLPFQNTNLMESDSQLPEVSGKETIEIQLHNWNKELKCKAHLQPETNRDLLLLVDDNLEIHEYFVSLLEQKYDLLHAIDGKEGLEMAKDYLPDLVISDIMMPTQTGLGLCTTLKKEKQTSHIPIILLSAKDSNEAMVEGFQKGADDYITKPFNSQILLARIKNLIQRKNKPSAPLPEKDSAEDYDTQNKLKAEKEFLSEFEEVIAKNLQTEGGLVEVVSQAMGMSKTSLYRKVKALSGKSINLYIRDFKLNKAVNLMKEGNMNVSQAAFEVGFKNHKYFRKIFKEKFGELPSHVSTKKHTLN